jgi:adenosylcobinamide kinase/adenosylcobinamide-phosphate guanylyltransferase
VHLAQDHDPGGRQRVQIGGGDFRRHNRRDDKAEDKGKHAHPLEIGRKGRRRNGRPSGCRAPLLGMERENGGDMRDFPDLTLVTGGAASGKSRFAERLVATAGRRKVYVATAEAFDAEMAAKIEKHRLDRGALWRTIEAPLDLVGALGEEWSDEIVLVDCLTLWLSNHLLADGDLGAEGDKLLAALGAMQVPVVLVSNEVGQGVVPDNALARRFRAAQGALNQRIARRADLVVAVMSGLPLVLKGSLPEGLE